MYKVGVERADSATQTQRISRQICKSDRVESIQPHVFLLYVPESIGERHDFGRDPKGFELPDERAVLAEHDVNVYECGDGGKETAQCDLSAGQPRDVIDEDDANPLCMRRELNHTATVFDGLGAMRGYADGGVKPPFWPTNRANLTDPKAP